MRKSGYTLSFMFQSFEINANRYTLLGIFLGILLVAAVRVALHI